MNILITGANGQLGNEMRVLSAENQQYTYFFTDVQELDICDEQAVRAFVSDHAIDLIVNCAAYTAVDKAEDNRELCDKLNHLASGYLAEAAEARGAALIQVSTDYVFDGTGHIPYTEEMQPCPNSVYGITKLAGEEEAMRKCSRTMIMIGTPTYARDLARAIFAAIRQGIVPGVYHFSNEGVCSWYDFTVAIHRLAGITTCKVSPLHTDEYPAKAPRPAYSVLDKTKIKKTFGIEIPHWEASLAECIGKLENSK